MTSYSSQLIAAIAEVIPGSFFPGGACGVVRSGPRSAWLGWLYAWRGMMVRLFPIAGGTFAI